MAMHEGYGGKNLSEKQRIAFRPTSPYFARANNLLPCDSTLSDMPKLFRSGDPFPTIATDS
jgi:hypothetical protein